MGILVKGGNAKKGDAEPAASGRVLTFQKRPRNTRPRAAGSTLSFSNFKNPVQTKSGNSIVLFRTPKLPDSEITKSRKS